MAKYRDNKGRKEATASPLSEMKSLRMTKYVSEQDSDYSSWSRAGPSTVGRDDSKESSGSSLDQLKATKESHKSRTKFTKPAIPRRGKAQSLAKLSNALEFVDQCSKVQDDYKIDRPTELVLHQPEVEEERREYPDLNQLQVEGRFCVAISLGDGLVQHTTDQMGDMLGYPKDMWVGRSFLDFIHAEDKDSFSTHVTNTIHLEQVGGDKNAINDICVRIRIYSGLSTGFSVKGRKKKYKPFKLSVCFQGAGGEPANLYMFITAVPMACAYTMPLELGPMALVNGKTNFNTQHKADCEITWVDEAMGSYTGHLTQHILGHSILEFIHPADLRTLKDIFRKLVTKGGKPADSKAVRMKTKNNSYVSLNSTWSTFINPWTQQLEFVMGKHTVVLGPEVIHNFFDGTENTNAMSGLKIATNDIKEDIKRYLTRPVLVAPIEPVYQQPKIKNHEEIFESFMGDILKTTKSTNAVSVSVSESPPNYVELNFKENLGRYFNSQPKTLVEVRSKENFFADIDLSKEKGSDDSQETGSISNRKGHKSESGSGSGSGSTATGIPGSSNLKVGMSVGHQTGEDGMCSQDGSGSGQVSGSRGTEGCVVLTEALVAKHNKDMENIMQLRFKEAKQKGDNLFLDYAIQPPTTVAETTKPEMLPTTSLAKHGLLHLGQERDHPMKMEGSDFTDLYTYLHTSCDTSLPSSSEQSLVDKVKKVATKERPKLPEPFWNLQVDFSQNMACQYHLPHREMAEVLKSDQKLLNSMSQPAAAQLQLKDLLNELGLEVFEVENLFCKRPMPGGETLFSDPSYSESEEQSEDDIHLDPVNIFMEADDTFPEATSDSWLLDSSSSTEAKEDLDQESDSYSM